MNYTTIRDRNSLPKDVLSAKSVPYFEKLLQQNDGQKTNPIYSFGYGYEKSTHTRLRLGLSSLNEHLLKYNLSLSKFCEHCYGNHTETTEHYLLHCNRNTVSRTTLLLGIKHILCSELNIILQRDLCPTHLTICLSILSTNFLNAFFSTLNLQKYFQANPPCIILFFLCPPN